MPGRYVGERTAEWTATKLRWGLSADQAGADALKVHAETCETTVVHYTPALESSAWTGTWPTNVVTGFVAEAAAAGHPCSTARHTNSGTRSNAASTA
ncbi:hypothetical protein ACFVZW_26550 [Streptomyces sp. NPDC059567]|uniref:hypothetical protein n=1 Tax=Streptomyces sp. NPDC059567 TaxID=3346867 RepID=UPI0036D05AFC